MGYDNSLVCKICNKICKNYNGLIVHLRKHNISPKDYYDKYYKQKDKGICHNDECKKETNFLSIKSGYRKYCSLDCCHNDINWIQQQSIIQSNPEVYTKGLSTKLKNRPLDPTNSKQMIKTKKENDTLNNNLEIKAKIKKTWKDKTLEEKEAIKEKRIETSKKNGTWNGYAENKERLSKMWDKELLEKRQATKIKNGTTMDSETVQQKRKKNMKERGTDEISVINRYKTMNKNGTNPGNPVMREKQRQVQTRQDVIDKKMKTLYNNHKSGGSKINDNFAKILEKYNINFKREFGLYRFIYDFYLIDYNILLEINPSITHNINFNPYNKNKNKSKDYHYNKTLNANSYGYTCICIWDWLNKEELVKAIINNELEIIKRKPKSWFVDINTGKLYNSLDNIDNHKIVEVIDDGQDYIIK